MARENGRDGNYRFLLANTKPQVAKLEKWTKTIKACQIIYAGTKASQANRRAR